MSRPITSVSIAKKFDMSSMKGNEKQILTCLGKCRIAPDQHQHSTLATFAFFFVVTWDADALL